MNEFLNMGGYAFYVWSSIGVFVVAMLIDFIGLRMKEKTVKRNIKSFIKRRNN
jgi:heme exporter protein CcmD